jgi:acyl-homoserine-lactone acylase
MKWLRRIGLTLVALLLIAAFGLATWEPLLASRAAPPPEH